MKTTIKKMLLLVCVCGCFSFISSNKEKTAEIFAGIGYYSASHGGSAKDGALISAMSIASELCFGAAGCGLIAGAAVGL